MPNRLKRVVGFPRPAGRCGEVIEVGSSSGTFDEKSLFPVMKLYKLWICHY
jgi:hypothetical protein